MRESNLKERLLSIRDNGWNIPKEIDIYQFALEMMNKIGSTDPILRDELILELLWKMITEGILSKVQLRELLDISLSDKHLFCGNMEKEGDSVFNRAFTILIVRCIIYYHNKFGEDLLSEEEMINAFDAVIRYARAEKDVRGYVEDKGWVHATAHLSDALRTFALCNYIKGAQLLEILDVAKEKFNIDYYVYINEEAERMVCAIVNAIERKVLCDEDVLNWIRSFNDINVSSNFPQKHYWRENVKNLLRSLYFRLKYINAPGIYLDEIEKVLNKISSTFNNMKE